MPLFEIDVCLRYKKITISSFPKNVDIVKSGNVGMFLYYDNEEEKLSMEQYLVGIKTEKYILEAKDIHNMFERFYHEYGGAKIGGNGRKDKAMWINERNYIIEFPHCNRLDFQNNGNIVCNVFEDCVQGCVLDHFHHPADCPISEFYKNLEGKSVPFVMVEGFRLIENTIY